MAHDANENTQLTEQSPAILRIMEQANKYVWILIAAAGILSFVIYIIPHVRNKLTSQSVNTDFILNSQSGVSTTNKLGNMSAFTPTPILPRRKEQTVSPTQTLSMVPVSTITHTAEADWKTFSSSEIFYELDRPFSLQVPANLIENYSSGPDTDLAVDFNSQDFSISVTVRPDSSSSLAELTSTFRQTILDKQSNSFNCVVLPTCEDAAFSTREETLPNNLTAGLVRGPDREKNNIFEVYFLRISEKNILRIWFFFKDTPEWHALKQQVLESIRFQE